MGGGGRYPYPKHVWSPAGGWWSQPANWKMNTFIASCGMALICGAAIRGVAHREVCLYGKSGCFEREYLHNRTASKNVEAPDTADTEKIV
ncbi:hypothetical protein B0H16DRAFT_1531754 [Mycena metata]|uniref:Uncharacterized protein n=1 Tax=Mycena metata TaxID=1033252 RepID=A0AAD7JEM3_9AGAR|nr:hypothetical protein B0H16DRAFT_1531754 [Mycena metata]